MNEIERAESHVTQAESLLDSSKRGLSKMSTEGAIKQSKVHVAIAMAWVAIHHAKNTTTG